MLEDYSFKVKCKCRNAWGRRSICDDHGGGICVMSGYYSLLETLAFYKYRFGSKERRRRRR